MDQELIIGNRFLMTVHYFDFLAKYLKAFIYFHLIIILVKSIDKKFTFIYF